MHPNFTHVREIITRAFFFVCTLLLVNFSAHSQISRIYPQDPENNTEVRSVSFYSATEGYAAIDLKVAFTSDGGKTWSPRDVKTTNVNWRNYPVNSLLNFSAFGVFALDNQRFFVYGSYGYSNCILYSSDNGATYTLVFYNLAQVDTDQLGIQDLKMPGNNMGFAIDNDRIMRSSDNGLNWNYIRNDPGSKFFSINAIDHNNLFVTGKNKILKSTNGGNTWETITVPATIGSAFFLNAQEGWMSAEAEYGVTNKTYKTTDGGANWTLISNAGQPFGLANMRFVNNQTGFAFDSEKNLFYKSNDGGQFWERLGSYKLYNSFTDFFMLDVNRIWFTSFQGLYSTTNGGGATFPIATFKIDTTGYVSTKNVKLINYSKPGYTTTWLRNGVQFSTSEQTSYTRGGYPVKDTITLIVSNGVNKDTLSLYQEFHPPVELESFTPKSGAKDHMITLKGKNFKDVLSVSFGGQPAVSFTVVSETELIAVVGEGASGSITVTTKNNGTTSVPGFIFLPPPTFTSFTPTSSIAGNTIILTGTNFLEVQSVWVGGVRASYTVVNTTTMHVIVPSGGSGVVKVILKAGTVELPGFVSKPSLFSFTPDRDTEAGWLKIRGSSLTDVTGITVGGVAVQSFRLINADSIVALIGKGASGSVVVTAPGGSASRAGFTYLQSPVITGFSPAAGPVGTIVTINGSYFDPTPSNNIVFFGAVKAVVKTASANSLTVEVPAGASFVPLSVQTRNLTAWSSGPFNVTFAGGGYPAPNSFTRYIIQGDDIRHFAINHATDMDSDGKPDLVCVAARSTGRSITFFKNTSSATQVSFAAPVRNEAGNIYQMVTGDLNGDGKPDIVGTKEDGIYIFINNSTPGNISVKDPLFYPLASPNCLFLIDIDKDGKQDIISGTQGKLAVFRNISQSGQLTFDDALVLDINYKTYSADMDIDGDFDLLVLNEEGSGNLFLNESTPGKIKFTKGAGFAVGNNADFKIADMNNDGRPDIVVNEYFDRNPAISVNVLLNKNGIAGPEFEAATELEAVSNPYGLALVDIDGDGKIDIATSNADTELATYHNRSNNGQVNFSGRVVYDERNLHRGNFEVGANDLNGDGMTDLFVSSQRNDDDNDMYQLIIYQNNSIPKPYVGSFTPVSAASGTTVTIKGFHFNGSTAVKFGGVNAASFNIINDSLITAVVGTGATGDVTVVNSRGEGSKPGFNYGPVPRIQSVVPTTGAVGTAVVISGSGFNNNLADNIVLFGGARATVTAASSTQLTVTVPTNAAPGTITVMNNRLIANSPNEFIVTFPGDTSDLRETSFQKGEIIYGKETSIADMDNDGKQDLVQIGAGGALQVVKNISQPGTISFAAPVLYATTIKGVGLGTADLDGDGYTDVVMLNESLTSFSYRRNTTAGGAISFGEPVSIEYVKPRESFFNRIRVGDIDGDGRPDVVVSNYATHSLYYFKNLSDAGGIRFAPMYIIRVANPKDIRLADVDNDGVVEMLIMSGYSNPYPDGSIQICKHNTGTSVTGFTLRVANVQTESITTSDLDGDGKPELVGTRNFSLKVYKNNSSAGNISFAFNNSEALPLASYYVTAGDLNGDGKPDIVSGNQSYLVFLKNQSKENKMIFDTAYEDNIFSMYTGFAIPVDMDGDGVLDLALDKGNITPMRNTLGDLTIKKICKASDATLEAGITGSTYQWQWDTGNGYANIPANSNISGTDQNKLQLKQVPVEWNDYRFRCIIDGKQGRSFKLVVDGKILTPAVSLQLSQPEICTGYTTTVYTSLTNAGGNPSFKWEVNGVDQNLNLKDYRTQPLSADATIRVTVTSSEACVTTATASAEIIVKVKQPGRPNVTVNASKENICAGEEVTFTARVTEGLTVVAYHWKKNEQPVGTNNATYSNNNLTANDEITCAVEVLSVCGGGTYATSTPMKIAVNPPKTPVIKIGFDNADADYANNKYTVRATIENAASVISYVWMDSTRTHTWQVIPGAVSSSVVYSPVISGDKLKCIAMVKRNCGNDIVTIESEGRYWSVNKLPNVSPNPVRDILYIDEINPANNWQKLEIVSLSSGMKVMELDPSNRNSMTISVAHLAPGNYAVVLRSPNKKAVKIRFIKL